MKKSQKLAKWAKLIQFVGLWNALVTAVLKTLRIEKVMRVTLLGQPIFIRSATPDLKVAISSLAESEYAGIECEAPEVIIDAGANIGTSAIFFALRYPEAKIFAIEPERGNFDMLVRNTSRFKNIVPICAALWGTHERRTVQSRNTGHWGYTVAETANQTESTGQEIECITLNELMEQHGIREISLLKMDIEGGEKAVLETSSSWMNRVKILTIELHDRICPGCTDAFKAATKDFARFDRHGEKFTAYRH